MKQSNIFKISLLLMLTIVLAFSTAQSFAATPRATTPKTKISTVNWNMMSRDSNGKRSKTDLYWFKFAFLDLSMSSGTLLKLYLWELGTRHDLR